MHPSHHFFLNLLQETFTAKFSAACSAVISAGEISLSVVGDFFANILVELRAFVFAVFHADFSRKGNTNTINDCRDSV